MLVTVLRHDVQDRPYKAIKPDARFSYTTHASRDSLSFGQLEKKNRWKSETPDGSSRVRTGGLFRERARAGISTMANAVRPRCQNRDVLFWLYFESHSDSRGRYTALFVATPSQTTIVREACRIEAPNKPFRTGRCRPGCHVQVASATPLGAHTLEETYILAEAP